MSEKMFNTRIIHKHDTAENWEKATGFIPKSGELIVYDIDANYNYERLKVGDGTTPVTELPFWDENVSWNTLKDRPFGETPTGGDTLLWNGDTTGKTIVDVYGDGRFLLVKVSESTPPFELMQYGCIIGMMGEKIEVEFTQDQYGQIFVEDSPILFVIPRDATQEEIEQGAIFKEKGVYFLKIGEDFIESLTIPGYTEFPGITKIDEKYLPDYDFAGKRVENKEFEINGETVIANNGAEIFNNYLLNKATGFYSHAEGDSTIASGESSHAEGYYTEASGENSHAEGHYTKTSGAYSHAEGLQTEARGVASHTEGNSTIAENAYTHVEGSYNLLLNPPIEEQVTENVRFGVGTPLYVCSEQPTIDNDLKQYTASSIVHVDKENIQVGDYVTSHAFDYETYYKVTSIENSELYGEKHQLVIPSREKGKYAHILGNGTYKNRSNAHTIDWDGNAWFQGDVYVSSTSGIDKDEGSKKLVTEDYVSEAIETLRESLDNLASKTYVDTSIASLVNSAPETLDTLGELATAMEENESVVNALNQAIANKADSSTVTQLQETVNAKAENSALNEHTTNSTIHITAIERAAWNSKMDGNSELISIADIDAICGSVTPIAEVLF